ncbi:Cysteine--tRNA ligase [Phycisphaerae bacterium RAS1]|nr:Cysteine--tRNA ligase [Phycisphaerae bacterium RAS1]
MPLKLYNTLGRKIEEFTPLAPPRVGMYVCGPTVYGHAHLGHAKSYVSFDAIVRWLRFSGYDVYYVQNITDVGHMTDNDEDAGEDKLIAEARRRGLHPMAVAETFTRSYLDDMDAMNLVRPDIMPRATGHISEQIELTQRLIDAGFAYVVNGSVYFDVGKDADYGKLSGRKTDELESGGRVAANDEKRSPLDFALWKRAEAAHIMRWPSPWGDGFPGWHLECSAMSQKYLGLTFDIHGGGLENQFPHHECEIAQSECAHDRPFARYWLHNNMCTLNGQKMSKSLGNGILLKDLFTAAGPIRDKAGNVLVERAFEPAVVKHFILTSHYRQTLDFSNDALLAAESGSYKLRDAMRTLAEMVQKAQTSKGAPPPRNPQIAGFLADILSRYSAAMNEDFNTAGAIAVLFEFVRQVNVWAGDAMRGQSPPRDDLADADALIKRLVNDALGYRWRDDAAARGGSKQDELIGLLAEIRNDARKTKNFALSDVIRNRLGAMGVELKDTPEGTKW